MKQKFVFISYSSKEYGEATKVCIFLESKGIKCWMAPRNILPGESYASQIVSALNSSDCYALILLASHNTNESGHVSNEVSIAFDNKKTIIPFRIEDCTFTAEYTYFLGRKHWINAFEGFEQALELLYQTLKPVFEEQITLNTNTESPTVVPAYNDEPNEDPKDSPDSNPEEEDKKFCTNCGSQMPKSFNVCTNCGQSFNKDNSNSTKFCSNCGTEMPESFPFCTNCGQSFNKDTNYYTNNNSKELKLSEVGAIRIITLILMILCTIANAFMYFFIPLLWCIPMIISYVKNIKEKKPISTSFKVCTILFLGIIPGILMFCDDIK